MGGGSKPDITTYFMGYCGLATAAPYNYSLLVTSYPDKGYIKSTEAALDPDARGWAVELEDTFIDCFELANAATKGSTPKKQVDTLMIAATNALRRINGAMSYQSNALQKNIYQK